MITNLVLLRVQKQSCAWIVGICMHPSDINGKQCSFTPSLTNMWELWLASPYPETAVISLAKSVITLWEETAVSDFMTSSVFSLVCHNGDKAKVRFGFIYIFENNVISHSREWDMMKKINQGNSGVWCLYCFQITSFIFSLYYTLPILSVTITGRRINKNNR